MFSLVLHHRFLNVHTQLKRDEHYIQWRTQDFVDVYAHFVLCVCWGWGWELPPHPTKKKGQALRFVRTSSYVTDIKHLTLVNSGLIW